MSELRLSLLGQVAIHKDGAPVTGFKSSKAVAVLCYLAVTGQPVARTTLVGLLWSELGEANAQMNLRHVIANLRDLVGEHLAITRQTVALAPENRYWLDVEPFASGVTSGSPAEVSAALALYQGDFLAGLEVRQAPAFEEWVSTQRTRLRELAVQAWQHLADQAENAGDTAAALDHLRRLLALEPWREAAHRQLMQLLARSGQIQAALAQYQLCQQVLADQLAVTPAAETTALYERLRMASQATHQLPAQTTPLVGRATELALITRYLADPACRCLTLVGPGGIGKTRLALEAAAAQGGRFLQGVTFVPLAGVSGPEFMPAAIAAALHLSLDGQTEPAQHLLTYLQNREMLLLLDNLEHLLAGRTLLADILTHAPHVKILATARERLNLKAEWVLDLAGLAFPLDQRAHATDEYSAVQLFVQTARRLQAEFALTDANRAAIGRICQLVEGMPLGIELAAAWVRTLTCDEIADELARNLDLLTTTQPDVPERHQSMQAVFAHSWALLPPMQEALLQKLAIFRGGFRRAAAQAVCQAALPDLAGLIDKGLLKRDADDRYMLHELMRQFAASQATLPSDTAKQPIAAHHCRYYLAWLTSYTEQLHGAEPQLAVALVQSELENLRQAWQWAITHGEWVALGSALPAWFKFYHFQGLYAEAHEWLTLALRHWPSQAGQADGGDVSYGRLLLCLAEILLLQARYQPARQQAKLADRVATECADPVLKGESQALLGLLHHFDPDANRALIHQQRAIPLLLQSGAQRAYAHLLLQMGKSYELLHRWEQALALQEEALQIFQQLEDSWSCAVAWGSQGAIHFGAGRLEQALVCYQRALALAQSMQAQTERIRYYAEIGRIYWRTQRHSDALEALHQAVRLAAEFGIVHRVSDYHRLLGEIYKELSDFANAHICLAEALRLARKSNALGEQVGALSTLAMLADREENLPTALAYSKEALQVAEKSGDARFIAVRAGQLGHFYARLGQLAQARTLLEEAVGDLQAAGIRANEPALPHNLLRLANILCQQGDYTAAEAHCRIALRILQEHGQTMFGGQWLRQEAIGALARCQQAQDQHAVASDSAITQGAE